MKGRSIKKGVLILAFLLVFFGAAAEHARGIDVEERQASALGTGALEDAVPAGAREILDDLSIQDAQQTGHVTAKLKEALFRSGGSLIQESMRESMQLLLVCALCTLLPSAFALDARWRAGCRLAGVAAMTVLAVQSVHSFGSLCAETIREIGGFSRTLLPVLASAAAAGGAMTSAAAKYAATALFMDVLQAAAERLVLPLVYAYLAASVGAAALENRGLAGAAGLLKWLAVTVLVCISVAFAVYLSLTGVTAGAADAAAVRITKSAISTAFPVVGGILSDAAASVAGGAVLLRNSIGVFGLAVVCAVCLLPLLRMALHYLLFKAVGTLALTVAEGGESRLISAVGGAYGILCGITGAVALMMYISIISVLKVVTVL